MAPVCPSAQVPFQRLVLVINRSTEPCVIRPPAAFSPSEVFYHSERKSRTLCEWCAWGTRSFRRKWLSEFLFEKQRRKGQGGFRTLAALSLLTHFSVNTDVVLSLVQKDQTKNKNTGFSDVLEMWMGTRIPLLYLMAVPTYRTLLKTGHRHDLPTTQLWQHAWSPKYQKTPKPSPVVEWTLGVDEKHSIEEIPIL